jgi:hypothetical protein
LLKVPVNVNVTITFDTLPLSTRPALHFSS